MCGICGKIYFDESRSFDYHLLQKMTDAMSHRGPDDAGVYVNKYIGLGHRRLSIIDLNKGKQPISNEDGTVWIVFNGEIYNYKFLRNSLIEKGHKFKTDGDTEVIIHSYEEYGEKCINRLRGMFAFAIWDERNQILLLARDRIGIKPLYYYYDKEKFLFGSEIKAILIDPSVKKNINHLILDRFLSVHYIPGDQTLLQGIRKINPGHYLIVKRGEIEIKKYWDLTFSENGSFRNFEDAKEELMSRLRESIKLHMISDVPIGFLLSGGVDSSALLSLAIKETKKKICSFTVGFSNHVSADERKYARLAANAFGTEQYDLTITSKDFGDFLPKYVWHIEEPICEPPAVGLYYISKLAKTHVKVLISGEGGDEAFAGYQTYRNMVWLERLKKYTGSLTGTIGEILGCVGEVLDLSGLKKYAPLFTPKLEEYYYSRASNPFTFFNTKYMEIYSDGLLEQINKHAATEPIIDFLKSQKSNKYLARMLYTDTKSWLPDDLLLKADKITMANSIELRVPLLDHELLEFAAHLPDSYKLHGFTTKYILKKAFTKIIPKEIINRKKTGFPIPYGQWIRKDLKEFVHDTLLSKEALNRGYFKRSGIHELLMANAIDGSYAKEIFCLLILELWHREFAKKTNENKDE